MPRIEETARLSMRPSRSTLVRKTFDTENGIRRKNRAIFLFLPCFLISTGAHSESASIKLGETDLIPELRLDYFQSDNAFLEADNPVETTGFTISPRLRWVADRALTKLEATYEGAFSSADESVLEFADHNLKFDGSTEISKRSRVRGGVFFRHNTEEYGTGLSTNFTDSLTEANEFTEFGLDLSHTYGASGARGNVTTGLSYEDTNFTNNESITRNSNRTTLTPYVKFSIRATGDTRVFLDVRYNLFDYENNDLDGDRLGLFVGTEWEATGKTGGSFRIGQIQRNFDNNFRSDSTLGLNLDAFYQATSFARFEAFADRNFDERTDSTAAARGERSVIDQLGVRWKHQWSSRVNHTITLSRFNSDRVCPAVDSVTTRGTAEIGVNVRRWLTVGLSALVDGRDETGCSTTDASDISNYDRTRFGLYTRINL